MILNNQSLKVYKYKQSQRKWMISMSWKQRFQEKQHKGQSDAQSSSEQKKFDVSKDFYEKYMKMTFFHGLSQGFKIYFTNIHKILLVFVPIGLIISLYSVFQFTDYNWYSLQEYYAFSKFYQQFLIAGAFLPEEITNQLYNSLHAWQFNILNIKLITDFIQMIIKFIPFTLGWMIISSNLVEVAKGKKVSLKTSISKLFAKGKIRTTIILFIILNILFAVGIAILFVPGMLFMMILGFGIFLLTDDNYSVLDNMRASFNFNDKHRFKTFGFIAIGLAFYLFLSTQIRPLLIPFYSAETYAEWFNPATRNWGLMFYYDFTLVFLQSITQPIIICLLAVQYVEISIKKDLGTNKKTILLQKENESELGKSDLIKLKEQNLSRRNVAHTIKSKGGSVKYFCPNCGQRILFDEKAPQNIVKCKNCGVDVYIKLSSK